MYRITKCTPTKTIFQELWDLKLNALIRKDSIDSTCGEYEGATIEQLDVEDANKILHNDFKIDVSGDSVFHYEDVEYKLNSDTTLTFEMSNDGDALKGESNWSVYDTVLEMDGIEIKFELRKSTSDLFEDLINRTMQPIVDEYAKEEHLTR